MIPDKIYLPWEHAESDVLPPGVTSKQVFGKDICYIRKDALLEWAKERLAECREQMERTDISERWRSIEEGYEKELCELIDKLNSL